MIPFYGSPDIQRWSIANHDLKHKGSWKTYKWPSKEFIYNYNKDATYRDHKVKEKSFPKTIPMGQPAASNQLIMTSGKNYKKLILKADGMKGLDPKIDELDRWDIYNEPMWRKWQQML